jgi:hypothetical protein
MTTAIAPAADDDELLTGPEARRLLRVNEPRFKRLRDEARLTVVQLPRTRPRYLRAELEALVSRFAVRPV